MKSIEMGILGTYYKHLAEDVFLYSSLLLFLIGPSRCFVGPSSLSVIRSSESSSTSVTTVEEILCFCPDNVSTEVALRRSSFVFPIFSEAVFFKSTCFVVFTSLAFSAIAFSAAAFSAAAFSAAALSAAAFSAAAFSAAAFSAAAFSAAAFSAAAFSAATLRNYEMKFLEREHTMSSTKSLQTHCSHLAASSAAAFSAASRKGCLRDLFFSK